MSDMSEIIKASLEGIKGVADAQTVVGELINTPSGVTIIPISKIRVGFIGGGADYGQKKLSHMQNFGGGSGTGISITPIAFLTVANDSSVNLISIDDGQATADRFFSLVERSPEIIERIKDILS